MSKIDKSSVNLNDMIWRVVSHIHMRRRLQFFLLLLLMVIASFAELVAIGAVMPFLMVLIEPDRILGYSIVQNTMETMNIHSTPQLMKYITVLFCCAAVLASSVRLLLTWANTRLSYAIGADLGYDIFKRTIYQPYSVHLTSNSSEIIGVITVKLNQVITGVVMAGLNLLSTGTILVTVIVTFLMISNIDALYVLAAFAAFYIFVSKISRKILISNSHQAASALNIVVKTLQESLGGIRDILLHNTQNVYSDAYRKADLRMRRAQGSTVILSQCPRYIIEPIGIVLIASISYYLSQENNGLTSSLPLLGALALGAQRMLPIVQQGYNSWAQIRGASAALNDMLKLLEQQVPDDLRLPPPPAIPFQHSLTLSNVSFAYAQNSSRVLNDIRLTIGKGQRIGFIGPTGSGKSTMLDLIMGLLDPVSGSLSVDDEPITSENRRAWQVHLAHVPQMIFLSDSTIAENIALGIPKDNIDMDRVRYAAKQAQLNTLIEEWPDTYETYVGERGVRLSGGQRQRIGIARALYKKADVIVFDEATSALDGETENAVMQAIDGLGEDITLLIIAHRLQTLKNCDRIVELHNGAISRVCSYSEISND